MKSIIQKIRENLLLKELGDSYENTDQWREFNIAYIKVWEVIKSANTLEQLSTARNYLNQLSLLYPRMEKTSRDYRYMSGLIIRKKKALRDF